MINIIDIPQKNGVKYWTLGNAYSQEEKDKIDYSEILKWFNRLPRHKRTRALTLLGQKFEKPITHSALRYRLKFWV